jgi:ABC-type nitrate/sulfonate/bicarbonate transport system permease component
VKSDVLLSSGTGAMITAGRTREFMRVLRRPLFGVIGVVVVLGIWEAAADAGLIDSLLMSSPTAIASALREAFTDPTILGDLKVSGLEMGLGLALAAAVGITIGVVCGLNRWIYFAVDPWLTVLYALPIVALAPLLINVVGIGLKAKVLLVFLFAVFPIAINTLSGVHATSNQLLNVAKIYEANRWTTIRSVVFPGALPFILAGLGLAGGRALVGMVVAEFTASDSGIGFRLQYAATNLQTALLMALLLLLGIVGVLYSFGIGLLDKRLFRWRPERQA